VPRARDILVINAGSSSIKFTLFDMDGEAPLAGGMVERIGLPGWTLSFDVAGREVTDSGPDTLTHRDALRTVFERLKVDDGPLQGPEDLFAIGHRVVHGGERFSDPALIDEEVEGAIRELFHLAPLHNPPNYEGILGCKELLPGLPQVAVFDTAFHQGLGKEAFLYAVPYELYAEKGVRRYGFHGTSHRYVALEAARVLGRENDPDLRVVTCHLGNGCSIAAVRGGRCVDTSMGLTPLEGLVMGTRCGDLDPAIVCHLIREEKMTVAEVDDLLNKRSGLLGLAGIDSGDMRDVQAAADAGNEQARTAIEVYLYRARKYVGAYSAALGGLDALVFTAGVAEHWPAVRAGACDGLEFLGVRIDPARNEMNERIVSTDESKVAVLVIPTNEELMIARDTLRVVSAL